MDSFFLFFHFSISSPQAREATKESCVKVIQHGILRKNRFLNVEVLNPLQFHQQVKKDRKHNEQEGEDESAFEDLFEDKQSGSKKKKNMKKRIRSDSIEQTTEEEHRKKK